VNINDAIDKLREITGRDLRQIAEEYGIDPYSGNKGWVGHLIEKYLGKLPNSSRKPDFDDWELKTIPLRNKNGELKSKEIMKICSINQEEIMNCDFEDSHLFSKIQCILIVARLDYEYENQKTEIYGTTIFDINDFDFFKKIENDYYSIRDIIDSQGFYDFHEFRGEILQTKPCGTSANYCRAFCFCKDFLNQFIIPSLQ